jgi:Flp pilus assembly protein TadG
MFSREKITALFATLHHRGGATLTNLVRADKGAAAVEFAIIAVPFIALLLAILQTGVVLFAAQALESATEPRHASS